MTRSIFSVSFKEADKEVYEKLNKVAYETRRSKSAIIILALTEWFKKNI